MHAHTRMYTTEHTRTHNTHVHAIFTYTHTLVHIYIISSSFFRFEPPVTRQNASNSNHMSVINVIKQNGDTPLHSALKNRRIKDSVKTEILHVLWESGADINFQNKVIQY